MANHKSCIKRIRQTKTRTEQAIEMLPKVQKMLDKLAKTNIIHKNKAANIKSSLQLQINKMA